MAQQFSLLASKEKRLDLYCNYITAGFLNLLKIIGKKQIFDSDPAKSENQILISHMM